MWTNNREKNQKKKLQRKNSKRCNNEKSERNLLQKPNLKRWQQGSYKGEVPTKLRFSNTENNESLCMCHANECMYVLKCINMNIIFLYVAWMEKKKCQKPKKNQINYKTKEGKRMRMICMSLPLHWSAFSWCLCVHVDLRSTKKKQ